MNNDCLFCKIANHLEPAKIISEDEEIIVVESKFPQAPIHLLVLPKIHLDKTEAHKTLHDGLYDRLIQTCGKTAEKLGLAEGDYKIIINGRANAHFDHEHLHLLGRLAHRSSKGA